MSPSNQSSGGVTPEQLSALMAEANRVLVQYADKDWNYSRISLEMRPLDSCLGPYVLWLEQLDCRSKAGKKVLKFVADEISWGERHSNELGILEIISLRINKALMEVSTDEFWEWHRPVVRVAKKETIAQNGVTMALWFNVCEISGEDFDNR